MSDGWQPPKGQAAASSPAGWYQQPDGRMRWWDGRQWAEHFHTPEDPRKGQAKNPTAVASRVLNPSVQTDANHQDILWSATGQPMTGIGAGRYWLTGHYLYFERGTLSTDSQQVPISAVIDVDVHQGMIQKSRGLYTVTVHIQRANGIELVQMVDIPNGREAQQVINQTANSARYALQRHQNTMHYDTQVTPSPSRPGSPRADGDSIIVQIEHLGKLRDAGVVTESEFLAKKAELLGRL